MRRSRRKTNTRRRINTKRIPRKKNSLRRSKRYSKKNFRKKNTKRRNTKSRIRSRNRVNKRNTKRIRRKRRVMKGGTPLDNPPPIGVDKQQSLVFDGPDDPGTDSDPELEPVPVSPTSPIAEPTIKVVKFTQEDIDGFYTYLCELRPEFYIFPSVLCETKTGQKYSLTTKDIFYKVNKKSNTLEFTIDRNYIDAKYKQYASIAGLTDLTSIEERRLIKFSGGSRLKQRLYTGGSWDEIMAAATVGTIVGGVLGGYAHDVTKCCFTKILEKIPLECFRHGETPIEEIIRREIPNLSIIDGSLHNIEDLAMSVRDYIQAFRDRLASLFPCVKVILDYERIGNKIHLNVSFVFDIDGGETVNPAFILELSSDEDEESDPGSAAASPVSPPV